MSAAAPYLYFCYRRAFFPAGVGLPFRGNLVCHPRRPPGRRGAGAPASAGELSGDEELVNSGDTSGEVLESGENNDVVISGEQLSGEVMEDEETNTLSDISGDVTSGENLETSETIM